MLWSFKGGKGERKKSSLKVASEMSLTGFVWCERGEVQWGKIFPRRNGMSQSMEVGKTERSNSGHVFVGEL